MIGNYYYGTGRRKSAVARVFLKQGSGKFTVNDAPVDEFFTRETGRMIVRQPLRLVNHEATFDIMVNVHGGGESGQAGAVEGRFGHARRARSRAKEGRPPQGPAPETVLETLTGRPFDRIAGAAKAARGFWGFR